MLQGLKTILEDELNFDGLVITDDMMMNGAIATTGSLSESFIEAIKAGNHIILSSTTPLLQDRFWTKSLNLMESDGDFFSTVKNAAIKVLETKLTYLKGENAVPLYPDISSLDEKVPAQGAEDFFLEQAARATTLVKSGNINLNSGKKILIAGGYRAFLSEGIKRFPQAETCYLSQSNSIRENQRILSNAAADSEIVIYCIHSYNLPPSLQTGKESGSQLLPDGKASFNVLVDSYERELIVEALKRNSGNMSAAARSLGLSPRVIHYKIGRLGITPEWYQQQEHSDGDFAG